VKSVYREYIRLYSMMSDETASIRKFDFMKYAARSVTDLDKGDFTVYNTDLDERGNKNALEMLQTFEDTTLLVKDHLNKQYREVFFDTDRNKICKDGVFRSRGDRETRRGDRDDDRDRRKDDRGDDRDRRRSDRRDEDRYDKRDRDGDRDRARDGDRDRDDRRGGSKRDDRDRGRDDRDDKRDDKRDEKRGYRSRDGDRGSRDSGRRYDR